MKKSLLKRIEHPSVVEKLSFSQMERLCSELRQEIVGTVAKNGGHLSPNLGTVELTVALLHSFRLPRDKIVWDVGHQCYSYKLLTGRQDRFSSLRQKGGLSGYPRTGESPYDSFAVGHSSTSIAAAYGIEQGNKVMKKSGYVVAVIGDGALTGGLAYEAINNVGKDNSRLIIVMNDNELSISKSEGALASYLAVLRSKPAYFKAKEWASRTLRSIPVVGDGLREGLSDVKYTVKQLMYPSTFFEQFGFDYMGPIDGHNLQSLCDLLAQAKHSKKPVILHIKTLKGKGYLPAELHPEEYHGVGSFDLYQGVDLGKQKKDFSAVFGEALLKEGIKDSRIVAITAAMESSTGLTPFAQRFKQAGRFFDVGIAEGYATTFAAGLATTKVKPVFAVYSTFLQRAYDQILHDCAIEPRHVVFAVDRAGLVGSDGETHQGIFDVAFFSGIPGSTIYAPSDYEELEQMLAKALKDDQKGPVAVRYPRGKEPEIPDQWKAKGADFFHIPPKGSGKKLMITYGRQYGTVLQVREQEDCGILKLGQIHPLPPEALEIMNSYDHLFFVEEGIRNGSIGMQLALSLLESGHQGRYRLKAIDGFVPQGTVEEQLHDLGLDTEGILTWLREV